MRTDSWHLTLRFLGAVEEEVVAPLVGLVAETVAGLSAFEVSFTGVGLFPGPRRPRVVSLGLSPRAELSELAERLDDACCRTGFPRQTRAFRPHLTLGRIRRGVPVLPRCDVAGLPPLAVTHVALLQSHLGRGGSRYEKLAAFRLGPSRGEP